MKKQFNRLKARLADWNGATRIKHLTKEIAGLEAEIERYHHAFETTAFDRDRLIALTDDLKYAFETTEVDRDRLIALTDDLNYAFATTEVDRDNYKSKCENLTNGIEALLSSSAFPISLALSPPPTAKLLLGNDPIKTCFNQVERQSLLSSCVPNVYCVGAPKSGTSFFYSIVREHPNIVVGAKDSGYIRLLHDFLDPQWPQEGRKTSVEQYLKMANTDYSNEPVLCDFDVGALSNPMSAHYIHLHMNPDARILLFLRDPVKRAVSEYVMRVCQYILPQRHFAETLTFLDAVEQEPQRERDTPYLYRGYNAYVKTSRYADLIEPYFEKFGSENVKVIVLEEEIETNLASTILETFAFMGQLDNNAVRLAGADHQFFADVSRRPKKVTVSLKDSDGIIYQGESIEKIPAEKIIQLEIDFNVPTQANVVIDNPSVEDVAAAQKLDELHSLKLTLKQQRELYDRYFREDVTRLEKLLKRDLSVWYKRYK